MLKATGMRMSQKKEGQHLVTERSFLKNFIRNKIPLISPLAFQTMSFTEADESLRRDFPQGNVCRLKSLAIFNPTFYLVS